MIEILTNLENHRETAVNVTQGIFSTMLAIDTWPVERAPGRDQAHTVVGAIHFAGAWKGVLLLECQPLQAGAFTARWGIHLTQVTPRCSMGGSGELPTESDRVRGSILQR